MRIYALLDENNKVINISLGDNNWNSTGWVLVPKNNVAYIDGDYFDGYFYPEQPSQLWTRSKGTWLPPLPKPQDGNPYFWDDFTANWVQG